jgi:Spy/CpxP family protein refolding chaperone
MKKFNTLVFALISSLALILFAGVPAKAQLPDDSQQPKQMQLQRQARRLNLLQYLNLTPEQIQQIRAINQETRLNVREANQRLRQARRALDMAVYAETPNQAEVEQRTREFTEAQAQAVKLRVNVEFRIRQILTSEQLVRFRELRQRAGQGLRQRLQQRPQNRPLQ